MTTLDFDKTGRCNISVSDAAKEIAFLGNDLFDNSISALKSDIEVCDDEARKSILLVLLKLCRNGNIFDNNKSLRLDTKSRSEFNVDFDSEGRPSAFVRNITVKHSGFWYAANNIAQEIENQKKEKHIAEGMLKLCDCLDLVIHILRKADSEADATSRISQLGFTEVQISAICNYPLTRLGELQKESFCETIKRHEKIISYLNEITI